MVAKVSSVRQQQGMLCTIGLLSAIMHRSYHRTLYAYPTTARYSVNRYLNCLTIRSITPSIATYKLQPHPEPGTQLPGGPSLLLAPQHEISGPAVVS